MSETLVPIAPVLPPIATSLTPGLPTAADLFDFAAGAERRFRTLRLRIEERTVTAAGAHRDGRRREPRVGRTPD